MAEEIIRPADLPNRASPNASEKIPVDNGSTVAGATVQSIVFAGRPTATKSQAEAGTNTTAAMTPLTVKQAIAVLVPPLIPPGLVDGDKGDVSVSSGGTDWTLNQDVVGDGNISPDSTAVRFVALAKAGAVGNDVADDIIPFAETEAEGNAYLPEGKTYLLDNHLPRFPMSGVGGIHYINQAGEGAVIGGMEMLFDPVRTNTLFTPPIWAQEARGRNSTPGLAGIRSSQITNEGAGYVDGEYSAVPLTGGAGSGATANIIVRGGKVISANPVSIGSGYQDGDVLSADSIYLGGSGSGFELTSIPTNYFNTYIAPGAKPWLATRPISRTSVFGTAILEAPIEIERCEFFGNGAGRYVGYLQRSTAMGSIPLQWAGQNLSNDPSWYSHDFFDNPNGSGYNYSPATTYSPVNISGITQANPGVVTTSAPHGLTNGQTTLLDGIGGMTQLNGRYVIVTYISDTSFSIAVNTTGFGAYTGGGTSTQTWNNHGLEANNPGIRAKIAAAITGNQWATGIGQVSQNDAKGRDSLLHLIKGIGNTASGYQSGAHSWIADYNSFYGRMAGRDGVLVTRASFFGNEAGATIQEGDYAIAIGNQAGQDQRIASSTLLLGRQAGRGLPSTLNSAMVIQMGQSLPIVIGNFSDNRVAINKMGVPTSGEGEFSVWDRTNGTTMHMKIDGSNLFLGPNRVLTTRIGGWGEPTGTFNRTTFATSTVTLEQLAQRVAALISDLRPTNGHGLIGA